jgi:hypothetical protein
MTRSQVIKLVSARLAKVGHGIVFEIIKDGVRSEEDWWYVPVVASRRGKDVPREFTVNLYANVEDELEEKHNLTVLFVPVGSESSIV